MMSISGISTEQIQAQDVTKAASEATSFFGEIWDTINPLQHIPIVSNIYRAVSETDISPLANIAGSTLYGGPVGGAVAAVSEGVSAIGDALFGSNKPAKTPYTAAAAPAQTGVPTCLIASRSASTFDPPRPSSSLYRATRKRQ